MEKTQTFKIWVKTLKKLRMLYALTDKSMVSIMDELVTGELERLDQERAMIEELYKREYGG